ncbi:MAG: phospholipase domain-containing protein, partial [Acidobacteriota bacterium]
GLASDPRVEIACEYARQKNVLTVDIELRVTSRADQALTLYVKDHGYRSGDHRLVIQPGSGRTLTLGLARSGHWYDFSVTLAGTERFLRRYAGRVETGKSGISDPVMGRVRV